MQKRNWASQSDKQGVPILARITLAFDLSVCMSKCRSLIHQGNSNTYSPCERCLMLQSLSIERCASISCTNKETSRTCISSLPNAVANLGMEKQWRRKRGFKKASPEHVQKRPQELSTRLSNKNCCTELYGNEVGSFTIIHSGSVLRSGSLEAKP